jgi:N-acetylmuramoyl-L-alanine amidase
MSEKFKKVNIVFLAAIITFIIINIILLISSTTFATNNEGVEKSSNAIRIYIDAGHGGIDPGAINKFGENESLINIEISKYLMSFLESTGYEVVMTRYSANALYDEGANTTIREKKNEDLEKRIKKINSSNADLVVSVHLNAFTQSQYYGAQSFYKNNCDKSKLAAQIMQNNLKNILDKNNGRVPQAKKDMKVLDESIIPTVLIECGFVSNPEEGKLLSTANYQEKVAWAIYAGILEYFEKNLASK